MAAEHSSKVWKNQCQIKEIAKPVGYVPQRNPLRLMVCDAPNTIRGKRGGIEPKCLRERERVIIIMIIIVKMYF